MIDLLSVLKVCVDCRIGYEIYIRLFAKYRNLVEDCQITTTYLYRIRETLPSSCVPGALAMSRLLLPGRKQSMNSAKKGCDHTPIISASKIQTYICYLMKFVAQRIILIIII